MYRRRCVYSSIANVHQWLKYTFWGPGTLLKCGSCCASGPKLLDGLGQSYLRHGLLLAVDANVVKGHMYTMAYVHCKQCINCNIAGRNRSANDTAYMLHVWGPWKVRSGLTTSYYYVKGITHKSIHDVD